LVAAEPRASYGTEKSGGRSKKVKTLPVLIKDLEKEMAEAAKKLDFEKAALLRDKLAELRSSDGSRSGA
jgi:excinuclease ABC subunit B